MVNPGDATEVVPYLTSGVAIMYLQKYLKTFKLYQEFVKLFPGADKWAHRFVAGVGTFIAALGIHISFAGTFTEGGLLTVAIPKGWDILHATFDFTKVFLLQQVAYDMSKEKVYVYKEIGK